MQPPERANHSDWQRSWDRVLRRNMIPNIFVAAAALFIHLIVTPRATEEGWLNEDWAVLGRNFLLAAFAFTCLVLSIRPTHTGHLWVAGIFVLSVVVVLPGLFL